MKHPYAITIESVNNGAPFIAYGTHQLDAIVAGQKYFKTFALPSLVSIPSESQLRECLCVNAESTMKKAFITDRAHANTANPGLVGAEMAHHSPSKANGSMCGIRRVCDKGEVRRITRLDSGRLALTVTPPDGDTFHVYSHADDIGKL